MDAGPCVSAAVPGNYVLEGATLKLCINNDVGGERPKKFAAPRGTVITLIVLKRKH